MTLAIISTALPAKPVKGLGSRIELRGKFIALYDGKVGRSERDGYYFEANADRTVVDLLASDGALRIIAFGRERRVPLKGIRQPLAQFKIGCFR